MAKSSWSQALALASLAGALAGCSTVPDNQPPKLQAADLRLNTNHGNARLVPQAEPPSRSGNPDTYRVSGRSYRVKESSEGYHEQGLASWYGRRFHGRKTSSGSPYNMFDMTAAHKSLPIPTYVQVTNLENGRQVVVKVNDRGPFVRQRILDLSYAAALELDMLGRGTAQVDIVALQPYQSLPELAARRTAIREKLASRSVESEPKLVSAAIQFAHEEPSQRVESALTPFARTPSEVTGIDTETPAQQAKGFTRPEWTPEPSSIRPTPQPLREPEQTPVMDIPSSRLTSAVATVKKTTSRTHLHVTPARPTSTMVPSVSHPVIAKAPFKVKAVTKVKESEPTAPSMRLAAAEQALSAKGGIERRHAVSMENKAAATGSKSGKPSAAKAATGRNDTKPERPASPVRRNLRAESNAENRQEVQVAGRLSGAIRPSALRLAAVKVVPSRASTD